MCLQIQHFYAHASNFPNELHARTVLKHVDMHYHYSVLEIPRSQDVVLQKDKVTVSLHAQNCNSALNAKAHLHFHLCSLV